MKQRTDLHFRKAAPRATRYELPDRDGLVLEVQPSGRKTWRYRYRLDGRREKVTIGPYPTITLEEARDRRRAAEKLVLEGKSPAEQKQRTLETRRGPKQAAMATVADVGRSWIEGELKVSSKNARQDITYFERDILPVIGTRDPKSIQARDVWICVENVTRRGHGQAARRVHSVLKRIFEYGMSMGVVTSNPALILKPKHIAPANKRTRTLSDAEIRQFDAAIDASRLSIPLRLALRFLLLVPARKGELVHARWTEIDFEAGTWTIPEGNAKMKKALVQKLPEQALAMLRELEVMASGSPWVLASPKGRGRHPIALSTLNSALRTVANLPAGIVIHDLRRTVSTGLGELGVNDTVAELCLNHRKGGTEGIYDRAERLEARHEALCLWANRVDRALGRTNVTPFRAPRRKAGPGGTAA